MTQAAIPFRDKTPYVGTVEQWPKLKLDAKQRQLWDETCAATLWLQPSFSDIWYAMMVDKDGKTAFFTDQIPVAGTDDKLLYINPATYFPHTIEQRVFINLHEILHATFNHCGLFHRLRIDGQIRYPDGLVLPYIESLMQISADCVINAILIEGECGEPPPDCWYIPKLITGKLSVLDAYRVMYKKCKQPNGGMGVPKNGSGGGKPKPGSPPAGPGKSFDTHMTPGQGRNVSPGEAEAERDPQQWVNAINAAMSSGRKAGKLPANIERLFCSTMEPTVDWRELVCLAVGRHIGQEEHSWLYLNNEMAVRGIGFPSRVRHGCEHVVIVGDSSGSVNQKTMDMFMSNASAIVEQAKPRRITFVQCDATINSWDEIEDISDLKGKVKGGGGTNFCPPFERLKEMGEEPDVLVYLTDLEGPFPDKAPGYPVVWGCINKNVAPWGETVHIPPQAGDAELESYQ
jgi:hypothetical protein